MHWRVWLVLASLGAGTVLVWLYRPSTERPLEPSTPPLRYEVEYPFIGYSAGPPAGRVAALAERLEAGDARLAFNAHDGFLRALLAELDIDPSSQVLVFSKTSVRAGRITPATPRAIYFNDDSYVAYVPGSDSLEIAAMDPSLGPTFFALAQTQAGGATLERELSRCLRCHDSYSLSGGGVPRFMVGSGYIDTIGNLVSHEAWILTDQGTRLAIRWGGWYVSGRHGEARHLGNVIVADPAELQDLEALRVGNLDDLSTLIDTRPYLTPYSDIVALLVLEHQTQMQNAITRASYDTRAVLHDRAGAPLDAAALSRIDEIVSPLLDTMLFVGEANLGSGIESTSGFAAEFATRGRRDRQGRSLRDLQLSGRIFRYPLSYLIHSAAFDALPAVAKTRLYARLRAILHGEDTGPAYAGLSAADRGAILEILSDTKPEVLAPQSR